MRLTKRNKILVENRQRTEIASSELHELKASILQKGLLHPPVLSPLGDNWKLIAGERRLQALDLIAQEELIFSCDGATITPGEIPFTSVLDLSPVELMEAELDENLLRVDLSWQDKARAFNAIHEAKKEANPKQLPKDTARELAAKSKYSTDHLQHLLKESAVIVRHLDNPKISKARNHNEAYALILKAEGERAMAELAKRARATTPEKPLIELRHGDLLEILPNLEDGFVDLILADPPYGIGASSGGFRSRTVHHHNYVDDTETAQKIAQIILLEGFRISKPRANLFMFCDIDLFPFIKAAASRSGWVGFRTPILWQKSESEGLAPWGKQGFRRTYDMLFYATKGQRGLIASPIDILNVKRVARNERLHAAEKPIELLKLLISASTLPGDFVLDPCCGSGSTLVAAMELHRQGLGIESDADFFATASSNLYKHETADEVSSPTDAVAEPEDV